MNHTWQYCKFLLTFVLIMGVLDAPAQNKVVGTRYESWQVMKCNGNYTAVSVNAVNISLSGKEGDVELSYPVTFGESFYFFYGNTPAVFTMIKGRGWAGIMVTNLMGKIIFLQTKYHTLT